MEKVKLGEIFEYLPKSKFKAGDGKEKGKYKFFTSSNVQNKFMDEFVYDGEYLIFGTGGKASINYCNGKFSTSTDNFVVKVNKEFNAKLIFLYFKNDMKKLENGFKGASIKHISKEYINQLSIPKYDYSQQLNIVKKLDKVQEVIDIRKEQIEQLDKLIKSQFVEMFGDPNVVKDNDKIELKSIMKNANNSMARRGNDSNGNIVLRLVELQRNYIDYSNVNKISLKENEKKKYLLSEGDILFARVNGNPDNVGRCTYFKDIGEDVYHNDHIIRVKFDPQKVNPIYLCVLLNDEYGKGEFKNKIKTSAGQYTISQDGIEKVKIFLPPIELQNKFADFVKQIDKQKVEIQKSLEKIQMLQESLMNIFFR